MNVSVDRITHVLLTNRDRMLLRNLYENVVMSFWQIHCGHFAGLNYSTVINRLKRLESADMIERTRVQRMRRWEDSRLLGVVYQLAPQGLRELGRMGIEEAKIPSLNLASLEHDLLLNDLRPWFKHQFPGGEWLNGRYLGVTSSLRKIPDAVIKMPNSGKFVAIELELHAKSSQRYREIVAEFRSSFSLEQVIYVTPSMSIDRKIMSEIEGYAVPEGHKLSTAFFKFVALKEVILVKHQIKPDI